MKRWLSGSVRLWLLVGLSGCLSVVAIEPGWAEVKSASQRDFPASRLKAGSNVNDKLGLGNAPRIRQLSELEPPITNAQQLLAQSSTPITAVKVNPTPQGVEVILESPSGEKLQVLLSSYDRTLVANIPNTRLVLPEGETFRADNPAAGITFVSVTQPAADSVQVTVVGTTGVPTAELIQRDTSSGLRQRALVVNVTARAGTTAQQPRPEAPAAQQPTPPLAAPETLRHQSQPHQRRLHQRQAHLNSHLKRRREMSKLKFW